MRNIMKRIFVMSSMIMFIFVLTFINVHEVNADMVYGVGGIMYFPIKSSSKKMLEVIQDAISSDYKNFSSTFFYDKYGVKENHWPGVIHMSELQRIGSINGTT